MSVASTRGRRDLTRRRAQHLPECRPDWPSCCATSGPGTPSWSSRWTGAAGPCPDDPAIKTRIPLGAAPVAARVTGSVRHFASRYWGGACHSTRSPGGGRVGDGDGGPNSGRAKPQPERRPRLGPNGPAQLRADALAAGLAPQAWKRISAGTEAKGPRTFNWARMSIRPLREPGDGFSPPVHI